jgi:serine phosphatase RsbU (regulator of sigma subunit)
MAELMSHLVDESRRFAAGAPQHDDVTVVLLRRLPQVP